MSAPETVFLKIGGSLLSDKRRRDSFRSAAVTRLAKEIARAMGRNPGMRLLLGHGGGGFAHFPAKKYRTRDGLAGGGGWRGFAETRRGVLEMNRRVLDALERGGLRPILVAPCAGVVARGGAVARWDARVIESLLDAGQVPMIHGDAVVDEEAGFTILSTEELFSFLAEKLSPRKVILACDVPGVYLMRSRRLVPAEVVPVIDDRNLAAVRRALAGAGRRGRSAACDVTGGMSAKVERLRELTQRVRGLEARIVSGLISGAVEAALGGAEVGTLMRSANG